MDSPKMCLQRVKISAFINAVCPFFFPKCEIRFSTGICFGPTPKRIPMLLFFSFLHYLFAENKRTCLPEGKPSTGETNATHQLRYRCVVLRSVWRWTRTVANSLTGISVRGRGNRDYSLFLSILIHY